MNIALHSNDKTRFPNLALLKLSAWHKAQGHNVEPYMPLFSSKYDVVYSSKVFTWSRADIPFGKVVYGGTGYKATNTLPEDIEHICPDYDGMDHSLGFLTRGCPNKCAWCIVPSKEGDVRAHADIEEFARHKSVVLMDNNVLAHPHGIEQIEKIARLGLKVDFNQGLDSRLIDEGIARRLAALKWIRFIRLACDHKKQMHSVERAVNRLRAAGYSREIFCYVLVKDIPDALERVEFLRGLKVDPFAQPYRDFNSNVLPTSDQKRFARWTNHKAIFKTTRWENYQ